MKKKLAKYKPTLLLTFSSLVLFFLFLLFLPSQNVIFTHSVKNLKPEIEKLNFSLPSPAPYPQKETSAAALPNVTAESYLVLDAKSDVVMLSKNKNTRLKIASLTKLMTAIVAIDIYKANDVLTVKTDFSEGATIGLEKNERITFQAALQALLIPSANDAAQAIADNSARNFVELMNEKARALHLDNTLFSNPQGFDDGQNFSTVLDLARLGEYSLRFPLIKQIINTSQTTISNFDKTKTYDLTSVNQLLFLNNQVHGIKTGYTDEAGECLMSLFEKDGHELIIVVLKSTDRFADSQRLANFAFSNFIWEEPRQQMP